MRTLITYIILTLLVTACRQSAHEIQPGEPHDTIFVLTDSLLLPAFADSAATDSVIKEMTGDIDTRDVRPEQVVNFAQTLIGVPYKYASTDPANGFDCSGFITYVFNKFKIAVPRSSVDFTNEGEEVNASDARPGDLILFTGTDSTIRVVGHMGI
ncbi:MAG: C40 family peptidase, partial [Chitinophagaceae bacterium]